MRISTDKNYYKILGVARDATAETIKKKFRKLAKEHHPDTNAGNKKSEDKFKLISEAYEVLGDEKKKTGLRPSNAARPAAPENLLLPAQKKSKGRESPLRLWIFRVGLAVRVPRAFRRAGVPGRGLH